MYHLQCVKRILQCIKDTLNKGVPFYASNNGIKLDGYTNNDQEIYKQEKTHQDMHFIFRVVQYHEF